MSVGKAVEIVWFIRVGFDSFRPGQITNRGKCVVPENTYSLFKGQVVNSTGVGVGGIQRQKNI